MSQCPHVCMSKGCHPAWENLYKQQGDHRRVQQHQQPCGWARVTGRVFYSSSSRPFSPPIRSELNQWLIHE